MVRCLFVADLHGRVARYEKLFHFVEEEAPAAVFLGGDLLPSAFHSACSDGFSGRDFVQDYVGGRLTALREKMKEAFPRVFVILGNDDGRLVETSVLNLEACGVWQYVHGRRAGLGEFQVYGYAHVPPTPFLLKDWERYDVSRYTDPGSISPEEGRFSVAVSEYEIRHRTILDDLEQLAGEEDLTRAIFLFHAPPYRTSLDRAALDGRTVGHVPFDVHVGSIAVRRFIETRQPLLTLHGHVHESARLTGSWRDLIGNTHILSAAHDGDELALVRFDAEAPGGATRELV